MPKKKLKKKRRAKRVSIYPWYAKYLFAAARKSFRWSPAKREALRVARCTADDGYEAYRCADCLDNKWHSKEDVQVDHILPVVDPTTGFTTWDSYFNRMFCSVENLAVLCTPCHKLKSKKEARQRASARKEKEE